MAKGILIAQSPIESALKYVVVVHKYTMSQHLRRLGAKERDEWDGSDGEGVG